MSRLIFALVVSLLFFLPPGVNGAERIRVLFAGQGGRHIETWFQSDPLIQYVYVPSRDFGYGLRTMTKLIKQYFPRRYEGVRSYDFFLLISPEVYFFSTQQIRWMYDAIREGSGGMNSASVMSQIAQIHNAWAASILSDAFPNDAPAVIARGGGGTSSINTFYVTVNRDFPDPVLEPYLEFGIEGLVATKSRIVMLREGALAIAYQVGNFPGKDIPFIAVWDYEKGKTMTTGDTMDSDAYFSPQTWRMNEYLPDMFMNLIFYATRRNLVSDVEVYHRVRTTFQEFRTRMEILLSLIDFVDKFGASSEQIQETIQELEGMYAQSRDLYFEADFQGTEDTMLEAFDTFLEAEEMARKMKDRALLWVYVIEWLATTSTLMLSSFALWTLMVRRRLYRTVRSTKLG